MSAFQILKFASEQALDTAANVLAGATLTFSLTGVSTPTNAYADKDLTTPLANPLSADAAGNFVSVFLDPAVVYRIVLKSSAGVTLKTWDPANEQLLSQAIIGGYLYPRTQAEIDAGVTPANYAYAPGDVRRYGVVMDLVADQSAAVALALSAHPESIYIPAGTLYAHFDLSSIRGAVIRGAGRDFTNVRNWTDNAVFKFNNASSDCKLNVLDGFRIYNRDQAVYTTAVGILFSGGDANENDFHTFRNIEILDFLHGVHVTTRTIWNTWIDCHIYSCIEAGFYIAGGYCAENDFYTCRFGQNGTYGFRASRGTGDPLNGLHFFGCTFEKNAYPGVAIDGAIGVNGFHLFGGHMEENATAISAGGTAPRKCNIFMDAALCSHVIIDGMTLEGIPTGDPLDWSVYMSDNVTTASGRLGPNRHGATAIGAYRLRPSMWVEPQTGTIGSSVQTGGLAVTDFTASATTFTAAITFGGGSTGLTYARQSAYYRKQGEFYEVFIDIALSAKGSSTGTALITGLPFAIKNVTNHKQTLAIRGDQFQATVNALQCSVDPNGTSINLESFASGVKTTLTDAHFGNSSTVTISGVLATA